MAWAFSKSHSFTVLSHDAVKICVPFDHQSVDAMGPGKKKSNFCQVTSSNFIAKIKKI